MNIRPLHDSIIFKFEEDIDRNRNSTFKEKSDAGIITFADRDKATTQGRWGIVVAVGNSVKDTDIIPGARICIEPLKWTSGAVISANETIWKTDESNVLLVQST